MSSNPLINNPSNSHKFLEEKYGKGSVTSTTVPPFNKPNVKLAGKEFLTEEGKKVVFDNKGFPIFDNHSAYDTKFTNEAFKNASYDGQMRMATRDLREQIKSNPQLKAQFKPEQLKAIEAGKDKIPGYTWHHHQDTGRMQLVDSKTHNNTSHIGGGAMWDEGR